MSIIKFEDLPKATEEILEKLNRIEDELKILKANFQPKIPDELMTRQETADYFKISLTTLWYWTKKGILKAYGVGNRVYYMRNEIGKTILQINSHSTHVQ